MIWLPIPTDLPPGRYQVLTKDGVELGSYWGQGIWCSPGEGGPLRPTHWAPIADVLAATNAPTKEVS